MINTTCGDMLMSKETTMTIRLEPELRAQFTRVAESEHRPAAQLLRDLMRGYVEQFRAHKPRISAAERKRREEAFNYARASVGLEGFDVPDAYSKEAERFIRGEMDFSALTATVHKIAQTR